MTEEQVSVPVGSKRSISLLERIIFLVLLSGVFVLMIFWVKYLYTGSNSCVNNPLVYGAKVLKEENHAASISCSCNIAGPTSGVLNFDNARMWQDTPYARTKNFFWSIPTMISYIKKPIIRCIFCKKRAKFIIAVCKKHSGRKNHED